MSLALALALTACNGDKDGQTDDTAVGDDDDDIVGDDDDVMPTSGDTGSTITVPDPTGDPATIGLEGECPLATDFGGFEVEILYSDLLEYSVISGSIANGVVPITVLEEMDQIGDCTLQRRNNPFCDPACQAAETCDFDGTCIPYPDNQDLGIVTFGGLVEDQALTPVQPGNQYFPPIGTPLPHPIFEAGELIEVKTWNTTFGTDITMHGVGVERLDLAGATLWTVYDGLDFEITWVPPVETPSRSHVHMRLNIDQHGNTPVTLFCEFDDTGSGIVPASLISQLVAFGVTGFPNATLTRRTVDQTTMGGGCVDFVVRAPVEPDVTVDGFIPCTTDKDCPKGETCDTAYSFICQ